MRPRRCFRPRLRRRRRRRLRRQRRRSVETSRGMPPGMRCVPGRGVLLALGLFALVQACRRAPPPAPAPPRAAATVNGSPIPVSRVQVELDRMRLGSEESGEAKVAPQDVPKQARAVLDTLIDRALVLQRAKVAGLSVSEAEVQRATDALADDTRKSGAAWGEHLARAGLNPEQLSDETRERLLAEKYVAEQTRAERASATETRAWYDTHKAEFEDPEAVHCLQIVVRTPEEAKSVLDQLRAGAPFDKVARQAGTSPDARNGGDLGWFPKGTMPKVFDDTCFSGDQQDLRRGRLALRLSRLQGAGPARPANAQV